MRTTTATLHAFPSCDENRRMALRQAARDAGIRFIPSKLFWLKTAPSRPMGGDAA